MEGLLQSLRFEDKVTQISICQLHGIVAKRAGKEQDWRPSQTLYWQGQAIDRHSPEYQELLDEAYTCLFTQNLDAQNALIATGDEPLNHTVGHSNPNETILTIKEFCGRLTKLRKTLQLRDILGE